MQRAAQRRLAEDDIRRAFDAAYAKYVAKWQKWKAERIAVASELLGIPPGEINEALIAWCRLRHGRPAGAESAPTIQVDRRFAAVCALESLRGGERDE